MKVVFFSYAYPPLKYPRSIQVGRLALHSRHELRVIGCEDASGRDPTIPGDAPARRLEIIRVPRKLPAIGTPRWLVDRLCVPDVQRSWALDTARRALAERWLGAADVLVTFGDPMSDHLAGLALKSATGAPWIAHFSDPWADNPYRRHRWFTLPVHRALEARVVAQADRLVFTSAETVDLVMRKYPAAWLGKTRVLPHAFDAALYTRPRAPRVPGRTLRYVGSFYPPRSPAPLLSALAQIAASHPPLLQGLKVELVGHIDSRVDFRRELAALPTGLVRVHAPVDYRTSLELMVDADLLLVIDAASESSVFLPSKLIDYLGAGRPILAISPPGTAADLVTRLGGWAAHPKRIAEVVDRLVAALSQPTPAADRPWGDPRLRAAFEAVRVGQLFDAIVDGLDRSRGAMALA
jgi:hypothetical protein